MSCSHSTTQSAPATKIAERGLTVDQVANEIWGAGPKATFIATTAVEHEMIARVVPQLFEGAADTKLDVDAIGAAGFRLEKWRVGGDLYWALLEKQVHGAGAYVFRVGPTTAPAILLEAPHNYFDVGTGRIAAELFFTARDGARPRALFTNTMHRYQLSPGDKKKRAHNPADVAHDPEHAFSIATVAFARAAGGAEVIQLHGFLARTDEDDETGEVGEVAAVVSAGDKRGSSALSTAIARALAGVLGDGVKRYPEDVKLLGATTNAQGKLLRDVDGAAFVHVEMSAPVRDRLTAEADLRAQLAAALFDARGER